MKTFIKIEITLLLFVSIVFVFIYKDYRNKKKSQDAELIRVICHLENVALMGQKEKEKIGEKQFYYRETEIEQEIINYLNSIESPDVLYFSTIFLAETTEGCITTSGDLKYSFSLHAVAKLASLDNSHDYFNSLRKKYGHDGNYALYSWLAQKYYGEKEDPERYKMPHLNKNINTETLGVTKLWEKLWGSGNHFACFVNENEAF